MAKLGLSREKARARLAARLQAIAVDSPEGIAATRCLIAALRR